MLGDKSLAVFASAVDEAERRLDERDARPHGLDKLLDGYGIHMKKDAVFDYGAQFRVQVMTAGGAVWIRHPGIVHVVADARLDEDKKLLDTGFAAFFRMDEMVFPFPSSARAQARQAARGRRAEGGRALHGERHGRRG